MSFLLGAFFWVKVLLCSSSMEKLHGSEYLKFPLPEESFFQTRETWNDQQYNSAKTLSKTAFLLEENMVNQLLPVLCKGILPCMILSVSFWNSNYCLKGYKSHCVFLPPSFPCRLVQQPTKLLKRKEFPWKFQVFCCTSSNRHFESETEVVTKSPAHSFFFSMGCSKGPLVSLIQDVLSV